MKGQVALQYGRIICQPADQHHIASGPANAAQGNRRIRDAWGAPSRLSGIRAFSHGIDLAFRSKVTFFVGENGSGKSTLLETLAAIPGRQPGSPPRDLRRPFPASPN